MNVHINFKILCLSFLYVFIALQTASFTLSRGAEWWKSQLPTQSLDPANMCFGLILSNGNSLSVSPSCTKHQYSTSCSLKRLCTATGKKRFRNILIVLNKLFFISYSVLLIIQALSILSIMHNLSIHEINLSTLNMTNVAGTNRSAQRIRYLPCKEWKINCFNSIFLSPT